MYADGCNGRRGCLPSRVDGYEKQRIPTKVSSVCMGYNMYLLGFLVEALFDAGFLTGKVAQIVQFGATYFT